MEADKVDAKYKRMRLQVFLGIFIGYAGFYIVRKNFSMAIPELALLGFDQSELSIVLAMNAVSYALSKFLMGSVSDRSNARVFLPLGLVLAALSMMFMIVPVTLLGPEHKRLAIFIMAVLNFLVGWFNGMGWPPCGRVMTHWFSIKERGTKMSIWNCAHNVGGALVGPMAVYGAIWFGSWFCGSHTELYFLIGTYLSRRSSRSSSPSSPTCSSATRRSRAAFPRWRNGATTTRKITAPSRRKCSRPAKSSSNTS